MLIFVLYIIGLIEKSNKGSKELNGTNPGRVDNALEQNGGSRNKLSGQQVETTSLGGGVGFRSGE